MELINKARAFAIKAHEGQVRKNSGLPYIVHPEAVLKKFDELVVPLADAMAYDEVEVQEARAACLLHDVIEDTHLRTLGNFKEHLQVENYEQVWQLVVELTDTSKIRFPHANRAERKAIDGARMYGCSRMAQMIKVCDIMCNVSDFVREDPSYAVKYIQERQKYARFLCNLPSQLSTALTVFLEQQLKEVTK